MDDAVDIRAGRLAPADYETGFDELYPPLDRKRALVEASRCYFCHDAPCIEACPTSIDIPRFIRGIQTDNPGGAAMTILEANIMGGACARVCPTEILCEGACVRTAQENKPVRIGLLQRYATDHLLETGQQPFARAAPTGQRIAVVGAGPAGLSCAHALARHGHDVVVFEKRPKGGGLNEYGIAAYKVPHGFAQREVDFILGVGGIELRCGVALGQELHLRDLRREFSAVFIGVGLGGANALGVTGETLDGVMNAIDYIARLRQSEPASMPVGHDVVVIGGGNTAIDAAVQSRRLGAVNVTIAYRRGPRQMGATRHEQEVAQTNGVTIRHWTRPVRLLGEDGHVRAVELEYTQEDEAGRLMGTDDRFTVPADMVFKAIGQHLVPAALDGSADLLEIERGKIAVNEDGMTSLDRVWAGGDAIERGQDLTVQAVEDGKTAAAAIHRYLMG